MCKIIEDFKISLIEGGKSPITIESYVGDIRALIEFLTTKGVDFNGDAQRGEDGMSDANLVDEKLSRKFERH